MNERTKATASTVENMKRAAKAMRKAEGIKHGAALEIVAKAHGYPNWRAVTLAATLLESAAEIRRPEVAAMAATLGKENPSWSNQRVLSVAKARVLSAVQS